MEKAVFIFSLLALTVTNLFSQQSDFKNLTGLYLGKEPLGKIPELFVPGIISVEANFGHSAAVFSPDNSEVSWCTNVNWYTDEPGNEVFGDISGCG
jgi:hypothetical protein